MPLNGWLRAASTTMRTRRLARRIGGRHAAAILTGAVAIALCALMASTAAALPDGRAWELVSPAEKFGGRVEPITEEGGVAESSEDGSLLTYVTNSPIVSEPEGNPALNVSQILATRQPSGVWANRDIATPHEKATGLIPGNLAEYFQFSPDLVTAALVPKGSTPLSSQASEATPYLKNAPLGGPPSYTPLVGPNDSTSGEAFGGKVEFAGGSPDLKHVIVRSEVPLLAEPTLTQPVQLYEWAAGHLELVSVLPSEEPAASPYLGSRVGGFDVHGAVSLDGSHVFFTDEPGGDSHLYVRDTVTRKTVKIDTAQGVEEPISAKAEFQGATPDGGIVYFTDEVPLVPGASEFGFDLYAYDVTTGNLTDLTIDPNAGEFSEVEGHILGFSTEGPRSSAYFVARGVLTTTANEHGDQAASGENNLYVSTREGGAPTISFIGRLANPDRSDWDERGSVSAHLNKQPTRVAPNGEYLTFMSQRQLTGYENTDIVGEEPDEEVFLYNRSTARLTCVSCNPSEARPHGILDQEAAGEGLGLLVDRPKIWEGFWIAGSVPGWTAASKEHAYYQSRYLSDSGRLFFMSPEALVPADTNRKEDVYEYEPNGVGSCGEATGCISLISAGTSDSESAFLDASTNGNDAFILTTSKLARGDSDTDFDIYDAQVCRSGAPCFAPSEESHPGACASVATCRPALPPGAGEPPAATTGAFGEGNVAPPPLTARSKPLSRHQKLENALRRCAHVAKRKRAACRAQARRRFGPIVKRPKHKTTGRKGSR